jgi:two-component system CheB/CheR fusion protein
MAKKTSGKAAQRKPASQPKSPPKAAIHAESPEAPPRFPIVGIGASAGGLEALEQFLRHVPSKSGMAYVIIQHLDPTHRGAMVELLQRASPMRVVEVVDRMLVEPDVVYVIPPNADMSILHGLLHLMQQVAPRGLHLPIDSFFRSLAADRQEAAIGVVLSGMGSDGTLGLRAIKEKAGAAFVHWLSSAKFEGMPRSAIDAGLADVVAPAHELPERILAYTKHTPFVPRPDVEAEERHQSALEKVFILLRAHSGNDFSLYKRSTVQRRVERRMGLHQIDRIGNYIRFLRENPEEIELLFKELLIGVTNFFRDPDAWDFLRKEVIPELVQSRAHGGVIRAWVPACSTGEEAYSLAIVLSEAIEQAKATRLSVQIEKARQGVYPANIAADVWPERLHRYFLQDDSGYRVRKDVRETVIFAPQNVLTDPPFTRLDILSCRNLLIYLSSELQKKLIPLFHYSLNPGGALFLGSAETIGSFSGLFAAVDGKARIYRRLSTPAPAVEFPSSFVHRESFAGGQEAEAREMARVPPLNLQMLAERVIVQRFAPAAVMTSDKGDILYVTGRTGKFLEPAIGKANLNIFAMAREGLRFELSSAFNQAMRDDGPVTTRGLKVRTNGETEVVDLTVQGLSEPKELRGTMVVVLSSAGPAPSEHGEQGRAGRTPTGKRVVELERELQHARQEAQTIREEMQASQEELKSTNEELQSTNEELQSANEELTTSKEEMQSMNEELQTVNQELQSKVDDLARSNNDMRNLLNSTDVATLFLDSELRVRRFTTQTTRIIKLIPSDAGRPITDITSDLEYPDLSEDARRVLQTLAFKEKQVAARDGRWFTVRIMPYRTLENVISGLVITFTDSTAAKMLETSLREQASQLKQLAESVPSLVIGCRPGGSCDYVSQQWVAYTGLSEAEQLGYGWLEQVHPEDRERIREEWEATLKAGAQSATEVRIRSSDGAYRWFKARSVPIRDEQGKTVRFYRTHTDVDDLKHAAEIKLQAGASVASILEWTSEAAVCLDDKLAIVYCNERVEGVIGRRRDELVGRSAFDVFPGVVGTAIEERMRRGGGAATSGSVRLERRPDAPSYDVLVQPRADTAGLTMLLRRS